MMAIVKVQQTTRNTTINLPKVVRSIFKVEKHDSLLIDIINEDEIRIRKIK